MAWDFELIQSTTRQISGQISNVSLTNTILNTYINNYYQFDLPRELKIEEFYVQYQFTLYPNQPVYTLPGAFVDNLAFTHVEPKLFLDGRALIYTQDTNYFYSLQPFSFSNETYGYGDGSTTTFAYTTQFSPIYSSTQSFTNPFGSGSNVVITAAVTTETSTVNAYETFSDTPTSSTSGTLTSNLGGTGTINYLTGAVSITFNTAPVNGTAIAITYHYQQLGVPYIVLFYNRQFIFFPSPATAYQARIDAFQQPLALVEPTDAPLKQEWGDIICCGAALKILRDFGQLDKYREVEIYFKKEWTKLMSDTDNQYMAQRSKPNW